MDDSDTDYGIEPDQGWEQWEKMKHSKHDYPIEECAKTAADAINGGYTIYQRFSCEQCGQRLTMDVPNQFFRSGACDKCGHTTDITHCNYTAIKQA